ncbi:MAG: FecR domain-containing protein [Bacteroidetes bacterium]|nr:FecR domain-containing protein [Bacteroidota bacterium]
MTDELKNNNDLCSEMQQLIDDQLDGMISLSDKQKLENHIPGCSNCRQYLKDTLETVNQLDRLNSSRNILQEKEKENIWENISSKVNFSEIPKSEDLKDGGSSESYSLFRKKYFWITGIAAVIALIFVVYAVKNLNLNQTQSPLQYTFGLPTYWKVINLEGTPMIGGIGIAGTDSIKEGQWITTDSNSRAELIIADIGKVTIEPGSKVVFVTGNDSLKKIMVEYGMINTETKNVNNMPFKVEIPSAVAENKDGSYTVKIDKKGDGMIIVKSGKLDVQSNIRDAIIPAGNIVMTKNGVGVGTPFNENASKGFKNALFDFDFGNCSDNCVRVLLDNAQMTDAVSLVNILNGKKLGASEKNEIYNKVVKFIPPPEEIRKDSIAHFNEKELEVWIEDIQKQVNVKLKGTLDKLEKDLSKYNEDISRIYFDSTNIYVLPDILDVEIPHRPDVNLNFKFKYDSADFNSRELEKEMEKIKIDIKNSDKYNKEELKNELEDLKKELQELNKNTKENKYFDSEEFKKEMEKVNEEIRKALKEQRIEIRENQQKEKSESGQIKDENENIKEDSGQENVPEKNEDK